MNGKASGNCVNSSTSPASSKDHALPNTMKGSGTFKRSRRDVYFTSLAISQSGPTVLSADLHNCGQVGGCSNEGIHKGDIDMDVIWLPVKKARLRRLCNCLQ